MERGNDPSGKVMLFAHAFSFFQQTECWNRLKLIESVKRCLIYLFRDGEIFEIDIISVSAIVSATILRSFVS